MRLFYDLHIHSCLSPCGDNDMTPYNLVNMAKFLGFDVIALTDHNSCLNTKAAVTAGKEADILVLPGMELCTVEEAHVVCLFPTVDDAMGFHKYVWQNTALIQNKSEIFGQQIIMDHRDSILGEENNMLIVASNLSIDSVVHLTGLFHGTAFPAHIDRDAYSVVSSLGVVPDEAGFKAVELSYDGDIEIMRKTNPEINDKLILRDSDAHYLENMKDPLYWMDIPEKSAECVIEALKGNVPIICNQ